ncbi:polysaccharide deacetylase family protein [Planosporangium flavigriseum]|nr:polysaccharide deacetylase family protein [Planosporangium flavigriseum]NJC64877.1 polysaccharide deacetylase family protein [Planosporangium flavigriseum]
MPFLAVLIVSVLAAAGCGENVAVRAANAKPITPPSAPPSPSSTATSPSSPAVTHAPLREAAPAPIPAAGRGPAGSLTTTGSDAVALTFDDGPDPKNTNDLLDLLRDQGVKATFCVVGSRAKAHPAVIRRIVAEGHTLCNHSWQHLYNLSERDDKYLMGDLRSTNDAIHAAAPDAKIEYFRAPGGYFTRRLVDFAARLNMKPIYWSVDDQCWQSNKYGVGPAMTNHITTMVQRETRPGGIILSHDNGKPYTIATYRSLLPWLKSKFRLEALPTSAPLPDLPSRAKDLRDR